MIHGSGNFNPNYYATIVNRLKNLSAKSDSEVTEAEIEEIAEKVVESQKEDKPTVDLDAYLREVENQLVTQQSNDLKADSKGLPQGHIADMSEDLLYKLLDLGVISLDEDGRVKCDSEGAPIINKEIASRIVNKQVSTWNEFGKALLDNSYSYLEDFKNSSIPENIIEKYFVTYFYEFESEEAYNAKKQSDLRFSLNFDAINKDFAEYLKDHKIETLEDLRSAIEWNAANIQSVNREIDEWVGQSSATGDCWLVSAILSLNSTDEGKKIIHDAIQPQDDGSFVVEFKGAIDPDGNPAKIKVTQEDIKRFDTDTNYKDHFSNGDNDMLVLEIATNILHEKISKGEIVVAPELVTLATQPDSLAYSDNFISYLEGSDSSRMIYLMTGEAADLYKFDNHYDDLTRSKIYQLLANAAENPNTVLHFTLLEGSHEANCTDGTTYSFKLDEGEAHAFAIVGYNEVKGNNGPDPDKSTVTFVNPWNSEQKYTVSWKEFVNLDIGILGSTNLTGVKDGTTQKPDGQLVLSYLRDDTDKLTSDVEQFLSGNMTVEQLKAVLKKIDINDVKVRETEKYTYVEFVDQDGSNCTLVCDKEAVNDKVTGKGYGDVTIFSGENRTIDGIQFTPEEFEKYFINAATYTYNNAVYNWGNYYLPSEEWPEGVTTAAELKAYINNNPVTPGTETEDGDDVSNENPDDPAVVIETPEEAAQRLEREAAIANMMKEIKGMKFKSIEDFESYLKTTYGDLSNYLTVVQDSNDPQNVLVGYENNSGNWVITNVTLDPNAQSTEPGTYPTLQDALNDMKLRETFCKGVYCQHHNPDRPAGDYTHQRHFVWDESQHKMIELPGVYFLSHDGHQAKGLDGYEQLMVYQKGYKFTDTPGVYEKDGVKFTFNKEKSEFEQVK